MKKVMNDNQSLEERLKQLEKDRKNFDKKYAQVSSSKVLLKNENIRTRVILDRFNLDIF